MISADLRSRLFHIAHDQELDSRARYLLLASLPSIARATDVLAWRVWVAARDCMRGVGSFESVEAAVRAASRGDVALRSKARL